MIIKIFDIGWGPEFQVKQFEQQILSDTLLRLENSQERVVVINSTWYTDDYHNDTVLPFLKNNNPDRIILISMLDPAIPKPNWFRDFSCPIDCIGYYPGVGSVDFWALFMDRYFETPSMSDLIRIDKINKHYMCLNRKPHPHRVQLCNDLETRSLINKGLVTLGSESGCPVYSLESDIPEIYHFSPQTGSQNFGMPGDITTLSTIENWSSHFLNIVTETEYEVDRKYFVSEKIYKPILGLRPFLVYAPGGASNWLVSRGFEIFCNDFTDISDLDLSEPNNIAPFLSILCQQPVQYLQHKIINLKHKIMHNRENFYQYVNQQKQKIKKELYDTGHV